MKKVMRVNQVRINALKIFLLSGVLVVSSSALAGNKHQDKNHISKHNQYVYGKVINVTPIYSEIKVSKPVKECWSEPVRYPRRDRYNNSAANTIAGGLIGGIIGHQIGKGRGKDLATAVGTVIGAQAAHDSSRGHYDRPSYDQRYTRYEERCETQHHVSYEEVIDSYRVNYRYKGSRYQVTMPYDPGKKIKLKISVEPVF